jgi:uncharacterized protein (TIGR02996 family)
MATTHEESFLQAIREHPDDDTPRLVYADRLEEQGDAARAEFIRTQVALAGLAADDARRPVLAAREQALLVEHRDDWLEPLRDLAAPLRDPAVGKARMNAWEFRRGFLESIRLDARVFLERAEEVFACAPVQELFLRGAEELTADVAASPWLERLTRLHLSLLIGPRGMEVLAASPHLKNLRQLGLSGNVISTTGARALAKSPHLTRLTDLNLDGNRIGAAGAEALAGSPNMAGLTTLNLGGNNLGSAGVEWLATSARLANLKELWLHRNSISESGARALAGSRHLARLEALHLDSNEIGADAIVLLAASSTLVSLSYLSVRANRTGGTGLRALPPTERRIPLTQLDLSENNIDAAGVKGLLQSGLLEAVTRLYLHSNDIGDAGAQSLAASPQLAQLEVLNLSHNQVGDVGAQAFAESKQLPRLAVLDLSENLIGEAGIGALAGSPLARRLAKLGLFGQARDAGMAKPVYEIDGRDFSTFEEFCEVVSRVLIPGAAWGHNLDAFNDILRGGFGTPKGGFVLRWKNSAVSRERLGYPETLRQVELRLARQGTDPRDVVGGDLERARQGVGPTVFDELVEIIRVHGAGSWEEEDGVDLILE